MGIEICLIPLAIYSVSFSGFSFLLAIGRIYDNSLAHKDTQIFFKPAECDGEKTKTMDLF